MEAADLEHHLKALDEILKWGLTSLGAMVVALAGAVVALAKQWEAKLSNRCDALQVRVDECEADRQDLRVRVLVLEKYHKGGGEKNTDNLN